jgi:hypothetical protein
MPLIAQVKRFLHRTYIYRGFYGALMRRGISTRDNALEFAMFWSLLGLAGTLLGAVAAVGLLISRPPHSNVWISLGVTVVCAGVSLMLVWQGDEIIWQEGEI